MKGDTLIGFDCDHHNPTSTGKVNVTSWSLLDQVPCDIKDIHVTKKNINIQLLELIEFREITVIQCKIKIKRKINRCSLFGYLEPVENGLQEYILDISNDNCKKIHDSGTFMFDSVHILYNLRVNGSTSRGIFFAGNANDSSCNTGSYSDQFGSWNNVIVEVLIQVTLEEYNARVNVKKMK